MRIALLSDIHGNLPALHAVLARISTLSVDTIASLGDAVGYGPFPNECVALVRERCAVAVKGNHDAGVLGETPLEDFNRLGRDAIEWTAEVLTVENRAFLSALPLLDVLDVITLVHASPANPPAWTYIITMASAREAFTAFTTPVCCIGHTHVPVVIGEDFSVNVFRNPAEPGKEPCRFLINVGSVGQPRDGSPDACFGLLDTALWTYEAVRVPYDIEATASAIKAARLPEQLARRLFRGA
jgi:diadenosine tetraphosphatase ApaH/serine/threonine PP2A family protein phosphatase